MKKIVSILLVLLVSLSLFADSGYIGIVTGPKVTTGSINNILVMSSDFSTESFSANNQNFNNSHWVLKLRGATFFDENKKTTSVWHTRLKLDSGCIAMDPFT